MPRSPSCLSRADCRGQRPGNPIIPLCIQIAMKLGSIRVNWGHLYLRQTQVSVFNTAQISLFFYVGFWIYFIRTCICNGDIFAFLKMLLSYSLCRHLLSSRLSAVADGPLLPRMVSTDTPLEVHSLTALYLKPCVSNFVHRTCFDSFLELHR